MNESLTVLELLEIAICERGLTIILQNEGNGRISIGSEGRIYRMVRASESLESGLKETLERILEND